MKTIEQIIDHIIQLEGGYSNNPNDAGGETMYGITVAVARANGYNGPMQELPIALARRIYMDRYWFVPGFDKIAAYSVPVAIELMDTGVNMGHGIAAQFLQQCLNAFNQFGKRWPDMPVDGVIGSATVEAFKRFIVWRGKDGEATMLKALNCLQGSRYIAITEANKKNEDFVYGWIANRVALPTG